MCDLIFFLVIGVFIFALSTCSQEEPASQSSVPVACYTQGGAPCAK